MRLVTLLLAIMIGSAICAAPFIPNLLSDPGFEDKSWYVGSWEVCEYKSEYVPEAHSGQVAAKLSAIKAGKDNRISAIAISKPVKVTGGQPYLLGLWYRTEPQVTGAVSIMSFSEPFATKNFKTPQTAYNTYSLPPSVNWRPWTLRVTMPEKSVEAVVLPRMQMVGTMWVDDVSLLPADQAQIKLTTAGEIIKLPDTRRYEGDLQLPQPNDLQLEVYSGSDGKLVKSIPADRVFSFPLAVPAGKPLEAIIVDPATRSMVAAAEFPATALAEFSFIYPNYRKSIYASDGRDRWVGGLSFSASNEIRKKITYATTLRTPDGDELTSKPAPITESLTGRPAKVYYRRIERPLPKPLKPGTYELKISVNAPDGAHEFSEHFKVVAAAPAGTHEFIIDQNNTLLMDGKPFFARGFMGGGPEVYGPVVKAGYNIASTFGGSVESQTKWLDGLQQIGMFGITGVAETYVSKHDLEGLRQAVRAMRNHPALLGYYFPDEPAPTTAGMAPADWQPYYDLMVEEDPYHPVMTTMYNAELADDYAPCLDILLFDPYPITKDRRPITMVSDFMTRAREIISDRKPVWCVPQAFGYDVVTGLDKEPTWTTPTPEQERCMTYLSLASGARGLLYYCYHVYTEYDKTKLDAGGWPWVLGGYLPEKQPALWGALAKIGEELQLLAPALDRPSRIWQEGPIFLREISPVGAETGYLIGVNTSETGTAEATVKLQSRLPRLFELEELERRTCCVTIAGNEVHIKLSPLQVGIWKLPGQP